MTDEASPPPPRFQLPTRTVLLEERQRRAKTRSAEHMDMVADAIMKCDRQNTSPAICSLKNLQDGEKEDILTWLRGLEYTNVTTNTRLAGNGQYTVTDFLIVLDA